MRAHLYVIFSALLLPSLALPVSAAPLTLSLTPVRFEFAASPGGAVSGALRVINAGDGLLPVTLGAEGFQPIGEEGYIALEEGDPASSLHSWVAFAFSSLTIQPKQGIDIPFTIRVPKEAAPGTRYGSLVATTEPIPTEDGPAVIAKAAAVVLLDVSGEVRELLTVLMEVPVLKISMPVGISLHFTNAGMVRAKPEGALTLTNLFGRTLGSVPVSAVNVLPEHARVVTVPLPDSLLLGKYRLRYEGTYGISERLPLAAEEAFWFVSFRRVVVPVAVLLAIILFVWKRRASFRAAWHVLKTGRPPEREQ